MSEVVQKIADIQKAPSIVPLTVPVPASGNCAETGVVAKSLNELQRPVKTDGQELLKNRFLCRGGGLLLVGPTGIGKSSLSMQMMISWALGRPLFGIEPAKPIKSLLIQAENDDGDLAEMRDGVFSGLNLSDADRELACSKIFVIQENTRTSEDFFNETVRPMLEEIKPDLLWIDPALAYLGGENNSQQAVGAFLRNQLNPLLTEFNCAAVVIHHTNKPYTGPERRGPVDFAYLGGGSAEWANWSRAILTLQKVKDASVFELRAAKRGNRLGWKEADGSTTAFNRFIAHNKEPGTICWMDVEPDLVEGLAKGDGKSEDDVVKHVPLDRPVAKNDLIATCSKNGLGEAKARKFIDNLVRDGRLFEWQRKRKSAQPEKYLARLARPEGLTDEAILTILLTGFLPCEDRCEEHNDRSSQLPGPLGPEKIGCEDRKDRQEGVALLPVNETKAREDQPREDQLPKPPACLVQRPSEQPTESTTPPLAQTTACPSPRPAAPGSSNDDHPRTRVVAKSRTASQEAASMPAEKETWYEANSYEAALVGVGRILLQDEDMTPWMSAKKVGAECTKHWKSLPQKDYSIRTFSDWTRAYFMRCREIRGKDVKVEYKTEPSSTRRDSDQFLKFVRLYPQ